MVKVGDLRLLLLTNKQNKRCRKPMELQGCRGSEEGGRGGVVEQNKRKKKPKLSSDAIVECFILRNHSEMALRKRARADDIPSSSTPAPSSATIRPDVQSSQTLVPMLQSLFRGQFIIMHNLRELAHHRPIITMEHFLE
ncbi:hypothetical protein JHK82_055430 [Glycine max]|nr:hypothetical protein JHK82_055430 [Glycine max]